MLTLPLRAFGLALLLPLHPVNAGPSVDAMANCLVMNTTGGERLSLIRWVLLAFAAHPEAGRAITVDAAVVDPTDREIAALFTALLTERCLSETKAALAAEGDAAMEGAFSVLGQVASQELAFAPEVNARMTGFLTHVDQNALAAIFP